MTDDTTNVVSLASIRPKLLRKTYRKHHYEIRYNVETKDWSWDITYVSTSHFRSTAKSLVEAQRAAEKHIDGTLKIRGE